MEILSRLMFDGIRIILQPINMSLQPIVFLLQVLQLHLQFSRIAPLLFISGQTVLAEDNMVPKAERQAGGSNRCSSSPSGLSNAMEPDSL